MHELKIHNSQTGRKESFVPLEAGKVRMYVCGMTVYDYCHLGHARVMVVFDVVTRYLRHAGYDVTYVRNITDVDDKIIQRANENGEDIDVLTDRFIRIMHEDAKKLGVREPDLEPRATTSMDEIIAMIGTLVDKGYAYQADNGDVYYAVNRFANYGQLSGKKLDELRAGERVEVDKAKQDPLDFVLWKSAKPDEPSWESPWGIGRPGWHIECSAMSTQCLGNHFDIHGGGMDLKFPHHENEIAQSEAATGEPFVNLWMHNGFVKVDEEKMSKSLGNFFTVREILNNYEAEDVRYFILASHYRSPLNYSQVNLDSSKAALNRLYTALYGLSPANSTADNQYTQAFHAAMSDDFNTPEAIKVLFDIAHEINRSREHDSTRANELAGCLVTLGGVLGLLQEDPEVRRHGKSEIYAKAAELEITPHKASISTLSKEEIAGMIEKRSKAREDKNWAESDRIRDELDAQGIVLEDSGSKTSWRRR